MFFEHYDGTIGTAIVQRVIPDTYIDDNNKPYYFNMLDTGDNTSIENYNTLPMNDPRVKVMRKRLKAQDKLKKKIRDFLDAIGCKKDSENVANALQELSIEYGFKNYNYYG